MHLFVVVVLINIDIVAYCLLPSLSDAAIIDVALLFFFRLKNLHTNSRKIWRTIMVNVKEWTAITMEWRRLLREYVVCLKKL